MDTYHIGAQPLTIALIDKIIKNKVKLALDDAAREKSKNAEHISTKNWG